MDNSPVTRAEIEALHPVVVLGIPLAVIIDQAGGDYEDLADPGFLEAFTRSLIKIAKPLGK